MNKPFIGLRVIVPGEWIDINEHMNSTHYGLLVYQAHVNFSEELGLGPSYVGENRSGKAVLESHLVYEREVSEGDELEVRSWLLGVDQKRLHVYHELHNLTKQCRAAVSEQLDIHMDLQLRKASAIPTPLLRQLQARVAENAGHALPDSVGRRVKSLASD
jgi:acyl-CoA thioester hydrolase